MVVVKAMKLQVEQPYVMVFLLEDVPSEEPATLTAVVHQAYVLLGLFSVLLPCRQCGPVVSVTAFVFVSLLVAAAMVQRCQISLPVAVSMVQRWQISLPVAVSMGQLRYRHHPMAG